MAMYTNNQYYEAILQLRPYDEKMYKFFLDEIKKYKNVFITQTEIKKYGIDLRLTSARFTEDIAKKLKKRFGGDIIKSKKLYGFSKTKGKIVYRLTICFRLKEDK